MFEVGDLVVPKGYVYNKYLQGKNFKVALTSEDGFIELKDLTTGYHWGWYNSKRFKKDNFDESLLWD